MPRKDLVYDPMIRGGEIGLGRLQKRVLKVVELYYRRTPLPMREEMNVRKVATLVYWAQLEDEKCSTCGRGGELTNSQLATVRDAMLALFARGLLRRGPETTVLPPAH